MYYRQPYEEVIVDGTISFQQNEKPNGVIQMLKNFLSVNNDKSIWIASSELNSNIQINLREEINLIGFEASCILRRVPITKEEVDKFYYKTCKEGFWPILHSFSERFNCDSIDWETFVNINKRFAKAACDEADDDAIIWIHDYNLWLVPFYIRQRMPNIKIAYFFHTTFPSPDIFNILPCRKPIIESLLCCDFISFDIPRYVENFVATVKSIFDVKIKLKGKVNKNFSRKGLPLSEPYVTKEIIYNKKSIKLDSFPEGTNYELIQKILLTNATQNKIGEIKRLKNGCKLIFAASRADYIKGTYEMLQCFDRLLNRQNKLIGKVVLFLISVDPGNINAYRDTQMDIEQLVARINKKFSINEYIPIKYSNSPLKFEDMIAWFHETNIMWIPSLRDGMNIICKEFIAANKGSEGVIILS